MNIIMTGQATPAQIGGYLVALRMKGESVAEIAGSARAMRANASQVFLGGNGRSHPTPLLDTAGTGGDGAHTFNISTTAAFVIAGAGYSVAKHGNRAASSRCGSADVLEALGVNLDLTPEQVGQCIEQVGIGFLFAPKFHPAMRHAIGPRRELAVRTIFNVLGPLTNPAGATHQLIGVFAPDLTEVMARVLGELGGTAAFIVHGYDGLDELTTSGPNRVSHLQNGVVTTYELDPARVRLCPWQCGRFTRRRPSRKCSHYPNHPGRGRLHRAAGCGAAQCGSSHYHAHRRLPSKAWLWPANRWTAARRWASWRLW